MASDVKPYSEEEIAELRKLSICDRFAATLDAARARIAELEEASEEALRWLARFNEMGNQDRLDKIRMILEGAIDSPPAPTEDRSGREKAICEWYECDSPAKTEVKDLGGTTFRMCLAHAIEGHKRGYNRAQPEPAPGASTKAHCKRCGGTQQDPEHAGPCGECSTDAKAEAPEEIGLCVFTHFDGSDLDPRLWGPEDENPILIPRRKRVAYVRADLHAQAIARAEAAEKALRELVESLPKCSRCPNPATRAWGRGTTRYCDDHKHMIYEVDRHEGTAPEYPRAAPLRAALALLAGKALREPAPTAGIDKVRDFMRRNGPLAGVLVERVEANPSEGDPDCWCACPTHPAMRCDCACAIHSATRAGK